MECRIVADGRTDTRPQHAHLTNIATHGINEDNSRQRKEKQPGRTNAGKDELFRQAKTRQFRGGFEIMWSAEADGERCIGIVQGREVG